MTSNNNKVKAKVDNAETIAIYKGTKQHVAERLLELIETSRIYEANVRMIQSHDQMTGSLVSRVLSARS